LSVQEEDDALFGPVPDALLQKRKAFGDRIRGKLVLAPLTKGGNLPFRRLCAEFGCEVTMSEMAFAKPLLKGDRVERARLAKAANEPLYGFQVATKVISEGVAAGALAQQSGADWLDINVGCPIHEASRRGLGAVMLRKPRSLAKLVHGVVNGCELPVSVKVRTGESEKKVNIERVARLLSRAGAAGLIVHGRTMEQRYRKPADWAHITALAAQHPDLPIIGNGDVLTHYDAAWRLAESGAAAVMAGRGALIRPWLFAEFKQGKEFGWSAEERVTLVYRRLVALMREHFGDDAMGRRKAWYFLPWHFSFFHRYRRYPQDVYGAAARDYPLILTRVDTVDERLGESVGELDPLERLLRCELEEAHERIAGALWDAGSDADAITALRRLASENLEEWEAAARSKEGRGDASRGGGVGGKRDRDEEY